MKPRFNLAANPEPYRALAGVEGDVKKSGLETGLLGLGLGLPRTDLGLLETTRVSRGLLPDALRLRVAVLPLLLVAHPRGQPDQDQDDDGDDDDEDDRCG